MSENTNLSDSEQNRICKEAFVATWNALLDGGIPRDVIAAMAMTIALSELTSIFGKVVTAHGLEKLPDTIRSGVFDPQSK
jgi:hypothetical protein